MRSGSYALGLKNDRFGYFKTKDVACLQIEWAMFRLKCLIHRPDERIVGSQNCGARDLRPVRFINDAAKQLREKANGVPTRPRVETSSADNNVPRIIRVNVWRNQHEQGERSSLRLNVSG